MYGSQIKTVPELPDDLISLFCDTEQDPFPEREMNRQWAVVCYANDELQELRH